VLEKCKRSDSQLGRNLLWRYDMCLPLRVIALSVCDLFYYALDPTWILELISALLHPRAWLMIFVDRFIFHVWAPLMCLPFTPIEHSQHLVHETPFRAALGSSTVRVYTTWLSRHVPPNVLGTDSLYVRRRSTELYRWRAHIGSFWALPPPDDVELPVPWLSFRWLFSPFLDSFRRMGAKRISLILRYTQLCLAGEKTMHESLCIDGCVLALGGSAALIYNYTHFFTEVLCQLIHAQREGVKIDYVHVPCLRPWVREALALLGFPEERVIDNVAHPRVRCSSACWAPINTVGGETLWVARYSETAPWRASALRKALRHVMLPLEPGKRLYVSRKNDKWRRCLNEEQVSSVMSALGFEATSLRGLGVKDTIELFSRAQVVVDTYGGGMCNWAFMSPGSYLLRIIPTGVCLHVGHWSTFKREFSDHFFAKCHVSLLGDILAESDEPHFDADYRIDLEVLKKRLVSYLNLT